MATAAASWTRRAGMMPWTQARDGLLVYVCPGLVLLYGLSFVNGDIRHALALALTQDVSVGGFLVLAVATVGLGAFVSAARSLADRWTPQLPPAVSDLRRRDPQFDATYCDLRAAYYPFYQSSANLAVAVLLALACWGASAPAVGRGQVAATVLGSVAAAAALGLSATDSIRRYQQRVGALVEGAQASNGDHTKKPPAATPPPRPIEKREPPPPPRTPSRPPAR